ncbi:O-antigen ligase family protein [Arenibaculum pallidiluteum]|uniref:O-antigen ligase family protein n=1 Tax=Arenibaculum pallidiluteum TaxID=2812559 RepID=UPI001A959374|nr:O-antigen ligase family protein [Arenibaculum pallidiluteum]
MTSDAHLLDRRPGGSGGAIRMPLLSDLVSIEAVFVLFIFAGRYKALPELQIFPVDLTVAFMLATLGLVALAVAAGTLRLPPQDTQTLLMGAFAGVVCTSVFWSSLEWANTDKIWRFVLLTLPTFYIALMLGRDVVRRRRLLRLIIWFSIALLAYYMVHRWVLGTTGVDAPTGRFAGNNYLEYGAHANILFIACLSVALAGARGGAGPAVAGACLSMFLLLAIGGRGPLVFALLAVPLAVLGLILRLHTNLLRLRRVLVLAAVLCGLGGVAYGVVLHLGEQNEASSQMLTLQRAQLQLSHEGTYSLDVRGQARGYAFRQWLERPIFGWGIGEFRVQHSLDYPHNLLLELLMEVGLAGAFLFFAVCVAGLGRCAAAARQGMDDWTVATIALLYVTELLSHLTVQGYLGDDRIFFAYLGLALCLPGGAGRPHAHPSMRAWT